MVVDARGLLCPLPTVKASLALEKLRGGDVLEVLSDDPVTRRDLPAWCRESGHRVLSVESAGEHFKLRIKKGVA